MTFLPRLGRQTGGFSVRAREADIPQWGELAVAATPQGSAQRYGCLNPGVDVDVEPEPQPDELRAILEALADGADAAESPWWRAGLPGADEDAS
jgi:hypothetical protein